MEKLAAPPFSRCSAPQVPPSHASHFWYLVIAAGGPPGAPPEVMRSLPLPCCRPPAYVIGVAWPPAGRSVRQSSVACGLAVDLSHCGLLSDKPFRRGNRVNTEIVVASPYISHYFCMIGQICDETRLLFCRCGTPWHLEMRECLNDYLTTKVAKRSRWARG
jgi:hypothetical protein